MATAPSEFKIVLSALGPSIAEQLKTQGLKQTGMKPAMLDRLARAITIVHIHGLLTDSECDKARKRLVKKLKVRWIRA